MFPQKQLVNTVLLASSHNIKLDVCDLWGDNCANIFVSDEFAGRLMYLKTQSSSIPPCCCETCREWNKVPGDQSAGWVWWCAAGRVMCLYVHAMIINLFAVSNVSACLSILSNQGQQRHSNKNKTITFQTKLSCLTGHLWHLNIDTHACQSLCYTWSDTAKKARQAANWDHQEWYPQSKSAMPMGNLCEIGCFCNRDCNHRTPSS